MNKNRPVNLDLRTIKMPPMAIVSILHRLSGLLLMFIIPAFLYMLDSSLRSEESFQQLRQCLSHPWMKIILWFGLSALIYHLIAGIRHMIMDLGFGESLVAGRRSAIGVMIISVIFSIGLGIWLC